MAAASPPGREVHSDGSITAHALEVDPAVRGSDRRLDRGEPGRHAGPVAGGRSASMRHLRLRRHALRRRAQHDPRAVRLVQRQRSTRCGGPPTTRPLNIGVLGGRRLRERRGAGLVLRQHHLRHHDHLRPDVPSQRPHAGAAGRRRRPGQPGAGGRAAGDRRRPHGLRRLVLRRAWATATTPPRGSPTGSQPEGMYMVTSGTHFNSGCCFDYGNAETNNRDTGNGHMDADLLRHAVLVLAVQRRRPVGHGRPGERPVPVQHRRQPEHVEHRQPATRS